MAARRLDPVVEPGRQHLHHLGQWRRDASDSDPLMPLGVPPRAPMAIASSSSTSRGGIEPPGAELVVALDGPVGVHGVAELAQSLDVATLDAPGDLKALGELGAGPEALGLQHDNRRRARGS